MLNLSRPTDIHDSIILRLLKCDHSQNTCISPPPDKTKHFDIQNASLHRRIPEL